MTATRTSRLSQERRRQAPEADALRIGCGWSPDDTDKPWILVESAQGDSHPSSVHLDMVAEYVEKGVLVGGGVSANYACTDICDGIAQGTEAMDYSLASREMLVMATEMHAQGGHFDGIVFLSSGDKAVPAHLMAAARLNRPAIVVPGGLMESGPGGMTLEGVGTAAALRRRGEMDEKDFRFLQVSACPSAGSCAFFGTASTMQMLAEALGMAMPAAALIPAHLNALKESARSAGERITALVEADLRPADILTEKAIENALIVHAATGGSTNALMHLAAIARERGIRFSLDRVNAINDKIPFLLNVKPSGRLNANMIWYAGGVYRIMRELRDHLHLDAMTVTGRTVGENLQELEEIGHFERMPAYLANYGATVEEIIAPFDQPFRPDGGIRVLFGNLAQDGAVIKTSAMPPEMRRFTGSARVFDSSKDALDAIFDHRIRPGDAVVIRYEGPAASGMPEQFYVTEAIASNPELCTSIALVTDGRFSGASRGPVIGHVTPEAARRGIIAVVEDGDLIEFDLDRLSLNIIGVAGSRMSGEKVLQTLTQRLERLEIPPPKHMTGLLGLYTRFALSATEGAGLSIS